MIFSYSGKPGGGKTYEAFRIAVLAKLAEGRNVVTNIVGLDETKITGYIIDKMGVDPDKVGTLKIVSDDDVIADNFFYFKGAEDGETVVNRGDVVVIDEVWRVFKDVKKIGERRESFIAEHRHFTSDDGKPCELHVINQDVSEIPKFIKNRLEACYEMTKLSAVGANNRYRVDVYSSPKMYKKQMLGTSYGKYEKEIYDLYKSFDGNFTDFGKLDGRTNGFKSIKFLFLVGLLVFLVLAKGGDIYRFFTTGTSKVQEVKKDKEESSKIEPIQNVKPLQTAEDFLNQGADIVPVGLDLSRELYLCGRYVVKKRAYAIVCQYNGTLSYKTDKAIRADDGLPYIILNGQKVMDFLRIRVEEKDKQ
jgi:putative phage-related membrane protein|nr:MAG TPA: zonular occludens toxin [Inoviridae sp.]